MTDSRRDRALTAARIRLRSPIPRPLLDETRIDEVCAELLAAYACACGNPLCTAAQSPPEARPATIDTQGGSGHG